MVQGRTEGSIWDSLACEHANERPVVCPCSRDCLCKESKNPCAPFDEKAALINEGRRAERKEILGELQRWMVSDRGWGSKAPLSEERAPLAAFLQWLETRHRYAKED